MMPLWFVLATVVVFVVSTVTINALHKRIEQKQIDLEMSEQFILLRRLARNLLIGGVNILWYVGASLFLIAGAVDKSEAAVDAVAQEVDDACTDSRSFRSKLGVIAQENINQLVAERDELTRSITETPVNLQSLPQYAALPEAFRFWLDALLQQQTLQAQAELDSMNDEIVRLMAQRDEIIESARADCPA